MKLASANFSPILQIEAPLCHAKFAGRPLKLAFIIGLIYNTFAQIDYNSGCVKTLPS